MLRLSRAHLGACLHDLPQVAHPARQMVPGHLPHYERQERHRRPRARPTAGREVGHRLAHQAEADGGHAPAQMPVTNSRVTSRSMMRIWGEKAGKVGRGAANKVPFVIAVATRKHRPIYTQLRCVPGFTKEAIKAYAEANIAPGARVVSDGLGCFGGLADAGLKHKAVVTGSGRPKDERFKWTNTGLGNIKS